MAKFGNKFLTLMKVSPWNLMKIIHGQRKCCQISTSYGLKGLLGVTSQYGLISWVANKVKCFDSQFY